MTRFNKTRSVVNALRVLSLMLALTTAVGCASLKKPKDEKPITDISQNVPEAGYKPSEQYGDVAIDDNEKVEQWIKYFTGRGRQHMHRYLERSARYIPMMKATFRERGMPDELAYIAMIESGFSATAFSHASAVGYWQFIRETGKRYNLRIDSFVDERRDPILSTQAAANYLDSLFSLFGDWHLALCSYNAGERRILNAVMKHRTREFWELAKIRRGLPKETANYIPKFIAAVKIAKDPAKYGFFDIGFQPAFSFDTVVIDKPVSLELLATHLGVDFAEIKRMNPRYKSDYVPVYNDRVNAVRVPVGMQAQAVALLPKIFSEAPRVFVQEFEFYKIRRGDTLSQIARRHRTSIARILDLNGFSKRTLLRIGQRIKVPDGNGPRVVTNSTLKKTAQTTARQTASLSPKSQLKSSTPLTQETSPTLSEKPSLGVRIAKDSTVNSAPRRTSAVSKVHVVRRGENLSTIARKYRTSVNEIAQANSLGKRSKLMVGVSLVIPN